MATVQEIQEALRKYLSALGTKGGRTTSPAKRKSSAENAKKARETKLKKYATPRLP
jgi:hypothetical protein